MNAKEELINLFGNKENVKCAKIILNDFNEEDSVLYLKQGFTDKEFEDFLKRLEFEYDNEFILHFDMSGTIWLNDNTWLTRGDHGDYSKWFLHKLPEIPSELK